ncbi:very short patch repair endonuclease [Sporosarcina sp. G11-34]|uniref:very short patch repair endonuclease n=1 Tax=Sporosarcina sp. G11-34 TaxID=2849605 RepID=UPI0022A95D2F|nr:very short patch repair endonuclease [Sporosarcina sp. G11-34]MCZ2259144.1 very short patch repair endonuclease [Sporosarcina sp. G11-34]
MADIMSKEQRSKLMGKIKSISKLENLFARALWDKGLRYRRNVKNLKGTPDIAIKKYKIVIFVDSCYWHACPIHLKRPKSNQDFWNAKFARNIARDLEVTAYYTERNWNIKRVWEHEIKKDFTKAVNDTMEFVNEIKAAYHDKSLE